VPSPVHFLLIFILLIGSIHLMRVLIDGGSGLINILCANTLDHMKISRCRLCLSEAPFYYKIILGMQAVPLGSI
jgi:hypothetical protein